METTPRAPNIVIAGTKIIIMLLIMNIMSSMFFDFDIASIISPTIASIYDFSDSQSKSDLDSLMKKSCTVQGNTTLVEQTKEACNPSTISTLKKTCGQFNTLSPELQTEENRKQCDLILSGELDKQCAKIPTTLEEIPQGFTACPAYLSGAMSGRDFFTYIVEQNTKNLSQAELSQLPIQLPFDPTKLSESFLFRSDLSTLTEKFIAVVVFLIFFAYICHSRSQLFKHLAGMCLAFGIMTLAIIIITNAWLQYAPPDTSFILQSILTSQFDFTANVWKLFVTLIPILFVQLIDITWFFIGIIFVILGVMLTIVSKASLEHEHANGYTHEQIKLS